MFTSKAWVHCFLYDWLVEVPRFAEVICPTLFYSPSCNRGHCKTILFIMKKILLILLLSPLLSKAQTFKELMHIAEKSYSMMAFSDEARNAGYFYKGSNDNKPIKIATYKSGYKIEGEGLILEEHVYNCCQQLIYAMKMFLQYNEIGRSIPQEIFLCPGKEAFQDDLMLMAKALNAIEGKRAFPEL